jgi:hypothetical protein
MRSERGQGMLIVEHTPCWMRNTRSTEPYRIWIKQLNAPWIGGLGGDGEENG